MCAKIKKNNNNNSGAKRLIPTGLRKFYVIFYPLFHSVLMEVDVLRTSGIETFAVCLVRIVIRSLVIVAIGLHMFCVTSVHLCADKLTF